MSATPPECWCDPATEGTNPSCPMHGDAKARNPRTLAFWRSDVVCAADVLLQEARNYPPEHQADFVADVAQAALVELKSEQAEEKEQG